MSQMTDRDSARSITPAQEGSHARDLRFAGGVSAGLISAILVAGALLAPVSNFGGDMPSVGEGTVQTVRLPATPRPPTKPRGGGGGSGPSALGAAPGAVVLAPPVLGGGSTPALGGTTPALAGGAPEGNPAAPGGAFPSGGGRRGSGAASPSDGELANVAINQLGV